MGERPSGTAEHWDATYQQGDVSRSWYQSWAAQSLRMLDTCSVGSDESVVDIGGGASSLVDALLARGHHDVTVLDISATALAIAQQRLGPDAERVQWRVADLIAWQPERTYRIWHDRAVLHFLVTTQARTRYVQVLNEATAPGALFVVGTFAPDGPHSCSGLPVTRYSPNDLAAILEANWAIVGEERHLHTTPAGTSQPFTWAAFRRR